jgi:hypothetical protein
MTADSDLFLLVEKDDHNSPQEDRWQNRQWIVFSTTHKICRVRKQNESVGNRRKLLHDYKY